MICPNCQARVADNGRHCDQCGAALPATPAAPVQRAVNVADNSGAVTNSHNTTTHSNTSSVSHTTYTQQHNSGALILALVIVALIFAGLLAYMTLGRTGNQIGLIAATPVQPSTPLSDAVIATAVESTAVEAVAETPLPVATVAASQQLPPTVAGTPAPVATSTAVPTPTVSATPSAIPTATLTATPAATSTATKHTSTPTLPAPASTPESQPTEPSLPPSAASIPSPSAAAPGTALCVRAEGMGFAPESETNLARRQRAAQLAAEIDAKRRLAEWSGGSDIDSVTVVSDGAVTTDIVRQTIIARVTGAETITQTYDQATGMATVILAVCDTDGSMP